MIHTFHMQFFNVYRSDQRSTWGNLFDLVRIEWQFVSICVQRSSIICISSLSYWGREKMAAISKTAFPNAFYWVKLFDFLLKCHWSLFPWFQLTAWVQVMAWRRSGDKPLSERMMVSLLTHICVTRPQWVKIISLLYIVYSLMQPPNLYFSLNQCQIDFM